MKCPDCKHEDHEFMWCQTDDCPCSKRYPTFCYNSMFAPAPPKKVFKARKHKK